MLLRKFSSLSSTEAAVSPLAAAVPLAVALVMAAVHLVQAATFTIPTSQFKNLHLGLALVLVFFSLAEKTNQRTVARILFVALGLLALVPLGYIHIEFQALISERTFGADQLDVAVTMLLLTLTLIATIFQWGPTLPIISGLALLYGYYGYLLPGDLLYHSGIDFTRLMSYAAIPFFEGLLGSLTGLSASLVFIFMLFAGLLKATGGIDFIMVVGRALGGRSRSGPAQIAVISSGFMGMISGSTVANVASTGSMTIPMMARFGFRREHAGAIEAVASTGGQFAPPVMGLTAFLIVGMTGIPYSQIMMAAVFPAIIYYGYLMAAVHLQTVSQGLTPSAEKSDEETLSIADATKRYGHLLLSIVVLVYLITIQMPPAFAALYAMAMIALTELVKQLWLHRKTPVTAFGKWLRLIIAGLDDGARSGAQLAIIIAIIGIFIDMLVTTGFAQKLSHAMLTLAGGNLFILLILAAFACLVFGLGMPTPAAYIIVALLGAPALTEFGIPLLAAHMFVFYFANMSSITPPVAVAALVASKIAKASYFRTAFASLRLGLPGFLIPFMFVYNPELLLLEGNYATQILIFLAILIAVLLLNAALVGHMLDRLSILERALAITAAGALLYTVWQSILAGAACLAILLALQIMRKRKIQFTG